METQWGTCKGSVRCIQRNLKCAKKPVECLVHNIRAQNPHMPEVLVLADPS